MSNLGHNSVCRGASKSLRSGWIMSSDGLAARTGAEAYAPAYEVIFWTATALEPEVMADWSARKAEHSAKCAEIGQKGAYGKLAALNHEFQTSFDECICEALNRRCGRLMDESECFVMAEALDESQGCELLAWEVSGNHVRVLLALSGEMGIDGLIAGWQATLPHVDWATISHVQIVMPNECAERIDEMLDSVVSSADPVYAKDDANEEGMLMGGFKHITVLLQESVDLLAPCEGKVIVDATLGGGGHTEMLLERGAMVFGIDQDPDARRAASARLARFGKNFKVLSGNFREIQGLLESQGVTEVDGILADLGVSSHQVDTIERGFSFREAGPLDMRMSPEIRRSAADLVQSASEEELARIIWEYGEERGSRAIARMIVKARTESPITTTKQLADIVATVILRKGKQNPATRTFQALRIAVNDELGALEDLLTASVPLLKKGGRMAVITFHSLEDRMVKQFFDVHSRPEIDRKEWPAARPNPDYCYRLLVRHPLVAGDVELTSNTRSRSAKLRGVEKIN